MTPESAAVLERVTPISAMFLDGYEHFALLMLVEPPAPGAPELAAVRRRVAARLDRSPRLRRRLLPTPLGLAPPLWADDEDFDVARHVDELDGGAPLDAEDLRRAVAVAFGRRLDMGHPPWGLTLLGTCRDGRVAVLLRVHHVLASGMTAAMLFAPVLFDVEPDAPEGESEEWRPAPPPPAAALLRLGARDRARRWRPRRPSRPAFHDLRAARRAYSEELAVRAPASPLNGELSEERGYGFAVHALADVRAAKDALPGHVTVNDVVLGTVAGGLATWLADTPAGLRAQVPVSLVQHGQASFGTSTSFMIVDLPLAERDPLRRVELVAAETAFRKQGGADAIRAFMSLAFRLPGPLRARVLARVTSERVQNLIVSDIPGPPVQLYFAGGAVSDVYPVMMLSPRHRLRIAAVSLHDRISFGITADTAHLPDPQGLADAIEGSLEELRAAV